jgi:hypothetical protein
MSAPTARELLAGMIDETHNGPQLVARVEAVLALHHPRPAGDSLPICPVCWQDWPCPTVRALNGDKA